MDTVRWDNPSLSTGWDMGALDAGPFSPIEANTMPVSYTHLTLPTTPYV